MITFANIANINHTATLFSAALSYAYNPDDSRASMTTPAGTFTYGYDADARPTSVTNPFSETSSWAYDQDSRLMAQTLANNIVSSYSYNPRSFLTDLLNKGGSTTLSEFGGTTPSTAMTYDALGDLTSVKANLPAAPASYSGTTTYQYDGKTELTQEATTRGGGFTHAFGYDAAENITQFRGLGQVAANADNQIGGTYDGNGNPSFVDGASAGFDVENRATNIGTLSETWGANGLRASEGGTYFLYDGSVPVCELSSTGTVTATNTFGASGLLSRRVGTASTFYTFDPMGNVAQRYTSTGSLVSSDYYDSFGSATSTATPSDPFGYEGQFGYYTEHGTSLILCGHRFYDSSAGRFITRDPIGYAGGINLYGYAGNNAVNAVDPSGYCGSEDDGNNEPCTSTEGSATGGSAAEPLSNAMDGIGGAAAGAADGIKNFFSPDSDGPPFAPSGSSSCPVGDAEEGGGGGGGSEGGGPSVTSGPGGTDFTGPIYRSGESNPGSLKPRPVDGGFSSYSQNLANPIDPSGGPWRDPTGKQVIVFPPGKPYIVVDPNGLPPGTVIFDGGTGDHPPGHVSVGPDVDTGVIKDSIIFKGPKLP